MSTMFGVCFCAGIAEGRAMADAANTKNEL